MKKYLLFLTASLCCSILFSQVIHKTLKSRSLNSTREIKIELPKNYDPESDIKHPVIVVFDGEYLFAPVSGQVHYQTYFDQMPQSIIVGVIQGKERFYDSYFDEVSGLPFESGKRFYDFVQNELLPYVDTNYNTSQFRVAVGHDLMGNFINSFLFTEAPVFQAYINLSPDYKGKMSENIAKRFELLDEDVFYYLATSDRDLSNLQETIGTTNLTLKQIDSKNLTYYYDELKGDTHYSLVTGALSKALDKIFELYKPMDQKELTEKVLTYEGTLDEYMVDRYDRIENYFGIKKPITSEEFQKLVQIADQREDIESLQKIGKLANKEIPESYLGTYYLALYAEKTGKTKKAVKLYESALAMDATSHIDKDFIMSRMDDIKLASQDTEEEQEEN